MKQKNCNLKGKTAIITGGRVKIGYAVSLKLLRLGANIIITTRFPHIAVKNFSEEPDFENWKDQIQVFGVDFRSFQLTNSFIKYIKTNYPQLDILINNAAQTIRKPVQYYQQLLTEEEQLSSAKNSAINALVVNSNESKKLPVSSNILTALMTQIPTIPEDFEIKSSQSLLGNSRDDIQPLDLRNSNSWVQTLGDLHINEFIEVQLINQMVPFHLIKEFKELMIRSDSHSWIINVTSMEGSFSYKNKTIYHPHTNMAKAALNMLTKTSAKELNEYNILMNAVDPGWVSDEAPLHMHSKRNAPLIPFEDAASRILDPIMLSILEGKHVFGKLFKNYQECKW